MGSSVNNRNIGATMPMAFLVTNRRLIAVLITLLVTVGFVINNIRRPAEPVYKGKYLSAWLDMQALAPGGEPEADDALRAAGTNAVPTLLRLIRARDSRFGVMLARLSDLQHLIDIRHPSALVLNLEGQHGFMVLRATGSNAVPSLINIYRANRSEFSKSAAADSLAFIGPAANKAIPILLKDVSHRNTEVRVNAISALGMIHSAPQLVLPSLVLSLQDSEESVRTVACRSIAKFKQDAAVAVPALVALLGDTSWRVRDSAVFALREIGMSSRAVTEALVTRLDDPNETVRGSAAEALERLGVRGTNGTARPGDR
jgi:HEAT repeat protein